MSLSHNTHRPFILKQDINRHFFEGLKEFRKETILQAGAYDIPKIVDHLLNWEKRGFIKIKKSIHDASDRDIIIEVLKFID